MAIFIQFKSDFSCPAIEDENAETVSFFGMCKRVANAGAAIKIHLKKKKSK